MDQVTYAEYKISLPELSCIFYVVGSNNYNGLMIVELSPQFVLQHRRPPAGRHRRAPLNLRNHDD